MKRRQFLALTTLAATAAWPPAARSAAWQLRARRSQQNLVGAAHPQTGTWSYNGVVPGPVLRYRQGERLRVEVENSLDAETTIHWHGLRVPNAMDGVPHLTQAPIAARGGRFVYEFDLPDAGTYWYHPHLASAEQVGRGLYGALVVEEREPPVVDRDLVWVLSDWRLDRSARMVADFGNFMDASHAGRIGNTVTVNGSIRENFAVRSGERIRLRLVNAATARIFGLRFEGHEPAVVAHDGQPVAPRRAERIVLGPGMRADLILDCVAPPGSRHRVIDDFYRQRAYRLLDLAYSDEPAIRSTFGPVPALMPNPIAEPDLGRAERHRVRFEGGMMGRLPMGAMRHGMAWMVNGRPIAETDHRHEPLLSFARGSSQVIEFANDTAWHHPIHLHGHVFRVLSRDGKPEPERPWADTVLLDPDSRAEVAFVADNPGDWMLHCHVLGHQASGMMAVVRVA
ncbi:MAG: copper oxidase [Betaproteobacteria bacterium RIFCSPLOWO2_02_FULL_66_14]|nr:MAG: copper oxidase [Betaproteobacteria bacterium RIFCSPLOWO2_02_FULL_66_14]